MKINDNSLVIINEIFSVMFGLFPSSISILSTEEVLNNCKREWWKGFMKRGIVDKNGDLDLVFIKRGVNKLYFLKQPFIPSFGEFFELCNDYSTEKSIQ